MPDEIRQELHQWNMRNLPFVNKVGWYILQKKKLDLMDYIHTMAIATTPLDEIALVLIARMYKVHIAFLMSEKYLTTHRNHDISKCKIVLAFRGQLTFNDTKKRPKTPPQHQPFITDFGVQQKMRKIYKMHKVIKIRITRIQTQVKLAKL